MPSMCERESVCAIWEKKMASVAESRTGFNVPGPGRLNNVLINRNLKPGFARGRMNSWFYL